MREERDRRRDYREDDVFYRHWHVTSGAGIEAHEPDADESLLRCSESFEASKAKEAWNVPEGWDLWFKIWLHCGCRNRMGPKAEKAFVGLVSCARATSSSVVL